MKKLFLFGLLSFSLSVFAQSVKPWAIGFQGGGTLTDIVGAGASGTLPYFLPDAGIHYRWQFHPQLSIQSEVNYGIRGYREPTRRPDEATLYLMDFLTMPILMRWEIPSEKNLRAYLNLGPYLARRINLRSHIVNLALVAGNQIGNDDLVIPYDWDWGLQQGLGLDLRLQKQWSLFAELTGRLGLRNTGATLYTRSPSRQHYLSGALRVGMSWCWGQAE